MRILNLGMNMTTECFGGHCSTSTICLCIILFEQTSRTRGPELALRSPWKKFTSRQNICESGW